jgi:hypothetical protein
MQQRTTISRRGFLKGAAAAAAAVAGAAFPTVITFTALGREAVVEKITLDSTQSPGDYPRGYEVCTSFDGQTWSKPVLTGKGDKPVTVLAFPQPTRARHVKITQTGSAEGLNWSIHTLKIEME